MFHVPKTLTKDWPWQRKISPHYEEVKSASRIWLQSLHVFDPKLQQVCDHVNTYLAAAVCCPALPKEHVQTASDFLVLFYVWELYTDNLDASLVQAYASIVMDALRHPNEPRPDGEVFLGSMAQQFWALAVKTASITGQRRFMETFSVFLDAAVQEAQDRQSHIIRSINDYIDIRRRTGCLRPFLSILEFAFDLPDEIFCHPVVVEILCLAVDMVCLDNDLCSYNVEQAADEIPHNIITVLMHHDNCTVEQAMQVVAEMHQKRNRRFVHLCDNLPPWGPTIEPIAKVYVAGIADCVTGNYYWNFESGRYFGLKGPEVYETRMAAWLPAKVQSEDKTVELNTIV